METIKLKVAGKDKQIILPLNLRFRPKTAIDITNILEEIGYYNLFKNKKVIDIGTGDTGMLARYASFSGAKEIYGIDIDPQSILFSEEIDKLNDFLKNNYIYWFNINFHELLSYQSFSNKFDFLLSNPPQLPCPIENINGFHDSCGETGRELIIEILENGKKLLRPNGKIVISIFSFLGLEHCDTMVPLFEIASNIGYKTKILGIFTREIRPQGMVEKSINHINKVFGTNLQHTYDVYVTEFSYL